MADYPLSLVDVPPLPSGLSPAYDEVVNLQFTFASMTNPNLLVGSEYVQRVWDTVAGDWVAWNTTEIDNAGSFYPGPGTFGVHTSHFRIETIHFGRV